MKKIISLTFAMLLLFSFSYPIKYVSASTLSDKVVMQMVENHTETEININLKMVTNTGIQAINSLELVFDNEIFTFTGYEKGSALSSLNPVSSTDEDSTHLPVKFNWYNANLTNDFSTGVMLTLHFKLKDNCKSGTYTIGLKYTDKDFVYFDEYKNQKTKPAVTSKAKIKISDNIIKETEIIEDEEKSIDPLLLAGIISFASTLAVVVIAIGVIKYRKYIKIKRKNEKWLKI